MASGCGEQEVGVASGSGWNIWVRLLSVVVRRYIDFFILLIPTPLVSVLFAAASLLFVDFVKCVSFLYIYMSIVKCRLPNCNIMTGIAPRSYASAHLANVH